MTLFGASVGMMKGLHGGARVREAHDYMVQSIDALAAMISEHHLDCDFERSGFLKVATSPRYAARIRDEIALFEELGVEGYEWLDADALAERVRSPTFLGGCLEPVCGTINPRKWVDALAGLAIGKGAQLYEKTRVDDVRRLRGKFRLATSGGNVTADKVVFATNGYTHLIPGMRSKQMPAFAFIVVSEPLSPEQRAAIGWSGREGIEDGRNFMHFYRLTPDNRILMGGGPGFVPFNGRMDHDAYPAAWQHLEEFIGKTFPALRGIRIDYRWGGGVLRHRQFDAADRHDARWRRGLFGRLHRARRRHDPHERTDHPRPRAGKKDGAVAALVRQSPLPAAAARTAAIDRRQDGDDRHGPR